MHIPLEARNERWHDVRTYSTSSRGCLRWAYSECADCRGRFSRKSKHLKTKRKISFLVLARRLSICYLFLGLCASGRERFIWLHFGREGEIFRVAARFRVIFINKAFRTRKKLERRSPVAKSKLISAMSSRKWFAWNDIAFGGEITSYQSCDAVV